MSLAMLIAASSHTTTLSTGAILIAAVAALVALGCLA